jgi:hypothetical protein
MPEKNLRVALLSIIEPVSEGEGLRALLRVGGHSVVRHQLGLALALGAERVIVLAQAPDPEITLLQHVAEGAGALFHRVGALHSLLALVAAGDEVLALGDGLLAWPDRAQDMLSRPGVLVQPVELGVAAGFERLDINHASAGAMVVPGRLVERLGEWPGDVDIFGVLQRLALQDGVPQRLLPGDPVRDQRWMLVRSEAEAHASEPRWIALHALPVGGCSPSAWAAGGVVRVLGPALLHAGSSGTVVALAALVLAALALVVGWFGLAVLGLGLCAVAAVLFESAGMLGRFERRALLLPRPHWPPAMIYAAMMDGVLLLVLAFQGGGGGDTIIQRSFAPLVLLGLARLVPGLLGTRRLGLWLGDRAVLALLLGAAGMAGVLRLGVALAALGLLGVGLVILGRARQLTQV